MASNLPLSLPVAARPGKKQPPGKLPEVPSSLMPFSHKRNTNLGGRRTIRSATLTGRVIRVSLVQVRDLNGTLIVDRRRIQGFIANLAGS
jgi:hypothetical protein